jgi:hypothetical protein
MQGEHQAEGLHRTYCQRITWVREDLADQYKVDPTVRVVDDSALIGCKQCRDGHKRDNIKSLREQPKKNKRFNLKHSLAQGEANEAALTGLIRIKLSGSQAREVRASAPYDGDIDRLGWLTFKAVSYQEKAKALVAALEARIKEYVDERRRFDSRLLDWNNREEKALAVKKENSRLVGAVKACESAITKIINGDMDSDGKDGRDLSEWKHERDEAEVQAAYAPGGACEKVEHPAAKAFAAAVDGADNSPANYCPCPDEEERETFGITEPQHEQ